MDRSEIVFFINWVLTFQPGREAPHLARQLTAAHANGGRKAVEELAWRIHQGTAQVYGHALCPAHTILAGSRLIIPGTGTVFAIMRGLGERFSQHPDTTLAGYDERATLLWVTPQRALPIGMASPETIALRQRIAYKDELETWRLSLETLYHKLYKIDDLGRTRRKELNDEEVAANPRLLAAAELLLSTSIIHLRKSYRFVFDELGAIGILVLAATLLYETAERAVLLGAANSELLMQIYQHYAVVASLQRLLGEEMPAILPPA